MVANFYRLLMDPEVNPLRRLPKAVRFQLMMVLSWMWSVIFCLWVWQIVFIGPTILGHSILLAGIFFTAEIFRRARKIRQEIS